MHRSEIVTSFVAGPWWSSMTKPDYERHVLKPLKLVARDRRFCRGLLDSGLILEISVVFAKWIPSVSGIQTLILNKDALKATNARKTLTEGEKTRIPLFEPLSTILGHISQQQALKNLELLSCIVYILPFSTDPMWYRTISKILKFSHKRPSFSLCPHLACALSLSTCLVPFSSTIATAAKHCEECRRIFLQNRSIRAFDGDPDIEGMKTSMIYFSSLLSASPIHALRLMIPFISHPQPSRVEASIAYFQQHIPAPSPYLEMSPIRCVRELCEQFFEKLCLEVDQLPLNAPVPSHLDLLNFIDSVAVPLCDSAVAVQYFLEIELFKFILDASLSKGLLPFFFRLLLALSHCFKTFGKDISETKHPLTILEHKHVVSCPKRRLRFEDCCFYPRPISHNLIVPLRLINPLKMIGCHLDDSETTKPSQDTLSILLESLLWFISSIDYQSYDFNAKLARRATHLINRIVSLSEAFLRVWADSHATIPLLERLLSSVSSEIWLESLIELGKRTIEGMPSETLPITLRHISD
jgi:hypothetical protein